MALPAYSKGCHVDTVTPAHEEPGRCAPLASSHGTSRAEAVSLASASSSSLEFVADLNASTDRVKLVRAAAGDAPFRLARGSRLENNLSWVVGCLELANAGDFAANVWNQLPVPLFAAVLMGVGGTVAAVVSVFAFSDARRAWHNIGFLRRQRLRLRLRHQARAPGPADPTARALEVLLAVSFRELWSEVINRWAMDVLMGFGAVLISAGTYMAIGAGVSDDVFAASNLLSGWIGNAPIAAFGLVNSAWAAYVWSKAQTHVRAVRRLIPGSRAAGLVKRRSRNVQVFCVVNGSATVLGGASSLLTSIYWWAYVMLIPVIVSSIFCNLWWRRRVGYTRSQAWPSELETIVPSELATSLEFAARAEMIIREQREHEQEKKKQEKQQGQQQEQRQQEQRQRQEKQQEQQTTLLHRFVPDPASLPDVMAFLHQHALFQDFCLDLVSDPSLGNALCGAGQESELDIGPDHVLALPALLHPEVLNKAQECLGRVGQQHFRNRERHMAELLGTYCAVVGTVDVRQGGLEREAGIAS